MAATPRRLCDLANASHVTLTAKDPETGEELSVDLPLVRGTAGPPCVDISRLHAATGLFTIDPGFTGTASCKSAITFIDGPAGELLHRGYAIDELAAQSSYLEVCYLLLNGRLPETRRRLDLFTEEIVRRMTVHERLKSFMAGFPDNAHPMAIMCGTVGALSAFYHEEDGLKKDAASNALAAVRVIAKLPTIAAMAYRHSVGLAFVAPRRGRSLAANLLHMCFASPLDGNEFVAPAPAFEKALDTFLLLHADHEQNASTSTVRMAASSEANPFACVAAGVASLWGPMHGGANEACVRMLRAIGSVDRIPEFLARAKDKADPFRLMGFGHRVYRNLDPRAREMKKLALACVAEFERTTGADADDYVTAATTDYGSHGASPAELRGLFRLASALEEAALADEYFVSRKLYPNVDYWSGIALTAMGIPLSLFTCLFAVGRSAGWIAQWIESLEDPSKRISRPRQVYVGEGRRPFPDMRQRMLSAMHAQPSFTDATQDEQDPFGYFF